jgi:hypothetical protein
MGGFPLLAPSLDDPNGGRYKKMNLFYMPMAPGDSASRIPARGAIFLISEIGSGVWGESNSTIREWDRPPPVGDAEPLQEDRAGGIADRGKLMELFPVIRFQPFQ